MKEQRMSVNVRSDSFYYTMHNAVAVFQVIRRINHYSIQGGKTMIKIFSKSALILWCPVLVLLLSGCGTDNGGGGKSCKPTPTLSIEVCDPDNGPFSLSIDNPFMPLAVGNQSILEGTEDGATIRLQVTVLNEIENVAGIDTQVVEEREWEDGELIEVSRNFFVQASDGTVCYYGEDVDNYDGGTVAGHQGTWRAGENENVPGIIMPGSPAVGQVYYQERAPGIAEDYAEITDIGASIITPAGTYSDTLTTVDTNPEDCEKDTKHYARDVGIIVDGPVRLLP
jgi:hypothetical protein